MQPACEPASKIAQNGPHEVDHTEPDGKHSSGETQDWKFLRGEVSGLFPAADRRGRVSADGDRRLSLRLRLSVSLPLKPVRASDYEGNCFSPVPSLDHCLVE